MGSYKSTNFKQIAFACPKKYADLIKQFSKQALEFENRNKQNYSTVIATKINKKHYKVQH